MFSGFDPSPDAVLAILATCAAGAKLAEEKTKLGANISAPLFAMASAMLLATTGIIPSSSPALDLVWRALMPLAVALSLLGVNLRDAARTSGPALAAFAVGAIGSIVGTVVAVGPGKADDDGEVKPLTLKAGDKVIYFKYAGDQMSDEEGNAFVVLHENDCLAKL